MIGPDRLRSYLFWRDAYTKWPKKFYGYKFPETHATWRHFTGKVCPLCKGWKRLEKHPEVFCLCETLAWRDKRMELVAEIETPIAPADINDLKLLRGENTEAGNADLKKAIDYLKRWVQAPRMSWIVIEGGPGTGKTHMLRWLKRELSDVTLYISAEMFQRGLFQSTKTTSTGIGVQEYLDQLSITPILLLDDWGLEHKGEWTTNSLAAVINRRYNSGPLRFPTVVTTNYRWQTLTEGSADMAVRRIASRLVDEQYSQKLSLRQADFRLPSTKKE